MKGYRVSKSKTNPSNDSLQELQGLVLQFAKDRDWLQFHSPKNISMAISAEAAELLEHFLWDEGEESLKKTQDAKSRVAIEEEVADVIILSLQFANVTGIDLGKSIRRKLALNEKKYPIDRSRGNARKYTEL